MKKIINQRYLSQNCIKNKLYSQKFELLLQNINKPARYVGVEPYSIHKQYSFISDENASDKKELDIIYKVILSYPDMYEIGMSNLTIKYFYDFINSLKQTVCERVFLPDKDLNDLLIKEDIPLLSLESWTPIKDFDLWAITLQTELTYSNILYMLKLAQINPISIFRTEEEPIIIIGGVSVFNPLPLSPFTDLFFFGEGEEAIIEIIEMDKNNKKIGLSKIERIRKLLEIDGVFSFNEIIAEYFKEYKEFISKKENIKFNNNCLPFIDFLKYLKDNFKIQDLSKFKTKRRVIKDLKLIDYPLVNILPLVQTIQDRISIEIARGCLNGCRFCQASFVYRPYREKDAIDIATFIVKSLMVTGYDECNLSGLSVSDYSNIIDLISALEKYLSKKNISVSVPSLRVASFDINLFDSLNSIRKSGITFAIEAGCEEIRNKINKEFDEEKFFLILSNLYLKGWKLVKLYFILGFPGIDDEEDKIIELLNKIKNKFPKLNVNVSISLLIPKPFTPFSFDRQIPLESFILKAKKIKNRFSNSRISIKYHDPYASYLEYFFANGAFDASYVLGLGYNEGICFDAWDEKRNKSFYDILDIYSNNPYCISHNIDLVSALENENYSLYLKQEKENYFSGVKTKSCISDSCNGCFICNEEQKNLLSKKYSEKEILDALNNIENLSFQKDNLIQTENINTYLIRFSKYNLYRYVGHLDFYKVFIRILKLSGINFEYTKGFNPNPKVFFPFASSLGMESFDDILIFQCWNSIKDCDKFCMDLNCFLLDGFKINSIEPIKSLSDWRKNTTFIQELEIPVSLNTKDISTEDLLKNLEKFKEKTVQILKDSFIEVSDIKININKNENLMSNDIISIILYLKTKLEENQKNIIKILNNSNLGMSFNIFSKKTIRIVK